MHHNPNSNFIGYGGAIKSTVEGEISCHMPHAYFLGMVNGSHDAPTYPGNIIQSLLILKMMMMKKSLVALLFKI